MNKFWWQIRFRWIIYVIGFSIILSTILAFFITTATIMIIGINDISINSLKAIYTVVSFWFTLSWALSFLIALMFSFKYLFNKDIYGKRLLLINCETKEPFDPIILFDVIPIWRRFFFFIIWILFVVIILSLGFFKVHISFFGDLTLFIFILLFGVVILKPLLLSMKNVRVLNSSFIL